MEYTIDVKDKVLGRVASEVAVLLRGKNNVDFAPNKVPDVKVNIINVNDIKVTGNKYDKKEYKQYSGYPGGLKKTPLSRIAETKGKAFIFQKAVLGMLPKNRLQQILIKNLTFKND